MFRKLLGALAVIIGIIPVSSAQAQIRCPLNVSDPALTQGFIPIYGGAFQGITGYNNPSEWKYFSYQKHWVQGNDMGGAGTFDEAGALLLKPDNSHVHIEWCIPYLGNLGNANITIPFRVRIFHAQGSIVYLGGELIDNLILDPGSSLVGDPMGIVVATGHLRLNSHLGDQNGLTNIHHGALNGWTNFILCAQFNVFNGSLFFNCASDTLFTVRDATVPLETAYLQQAGLMGTAFSHNQIYTQWGEHTISANEPLPLLGPLTAPWAVPTLAGYSYAASGAAGLQSGIKEIREGMDLHNGNMGTFVTTFDSGGVLDPAKLGGLGPRDVAFIWQTRSGNGTTNVTNPGEFLTSLMVTSIDVEAPDATHCQDTTALNVGGLLPCTYPAPPPGSPTVTGFVTKNSTNYVVTFSTITGTIFWTLEVDGHFFNSDSRLTAPFTQTVEGLDMSIQHTFRLSVVNEYGLFDAIVITK